MNLLIIFAAKYLLYLLILLAIAIVLTAKRKEQIQLVKLSIIALPLSYIIAKILSHFIYDPRPFMVEHVTPLITHAPGNGFPSDHTLLSMAIAAVIFTYNKKMGIVLAVLSVCIGLARVLAHVHHVEDIIGSIVIAITGTLIAHYALSMIGRNHLPESTAEKENK